MLTRIFSNTFFYVGRDMALPALRIQLKQMFMEVCVTILNDFMSYKRK
jgi:hypothetical protein